MQNLLFLSQAAALSQQPRKKNNKYWHLLFEKTKKILALLVCFKYKAHIFCEFSLKNESNAKIFLL